jgi:hypothetical protein
MNRADRKPVLTSDFGAGAGPSNDGHDAHPPGRAATQMVEAWTAERVGSHQARNDELTGAAR